MKLSRLIINNFRVFPGEYIFDFTNKQLVIIGGQNGHGKSSVFDAIQWCLTGEIKRYRGTSEYQNFNYLINDHAISNNTGKVSASVAVWLEAGNTIHKISRSLNKSLANQTTRVNVDGKEYGVKEGAIRICEILFRGDQGNSSTKAEKVKNLSSYFSSTQLLSQDQLHEFILASNPQERFSLMEKVLGLDRYGSEFATYLLNSIQVMKEEKARVNAIRQDYQVSLLEVSTQLKEKELLMQKLGGTTEKELSNEMSELIEVIRQNGINLSIVANPIQVDRETQSAFREIRQSIIKQQDSIEHLLLTLQEAKPLFLLTEYQFGVERKRLDDEIQKLNDRTKRREKGMTLARKKRMDMDSLFSKRLAFIEKQRKEEELKGQIQQLEQNIAAIESHSDVLEVIRQFETAEEFISVYHQKKMDLSQIDLKINIENLNLQCERLEKQRSEFNLQVSEKESAKELFQNQLDQVQSELVFLQEMADSYKENTYAQMIYDMQQMILKQIEQACPVCGTDFLSMEHLHTAVRIKWEQAIQQLTDLEQQILEITGKKNELVREIYLMGVDLTQLSNQIAAVKKAYDENKAHLEQQRLLLQEWKQHLSIEELKDLKQSIDVFIKHHFIAFSLLETRQEYQTELLGLNRERSVIHHWLEEQKKLVGTRIHLLIGEENKIVKKIEWIDRYLIRSGAQVEQFQRELTETNLQLAELVRKWNEQELKANEIQLLIPDFNKSEPQVEVWVDRITQHKMEWNRINTTAEHVLEKVEAFLSKHDVVELRKNEGRWNELILAADQEMEQYEKLEAEIELLREHHDEIRSTVMADYLIHYSESIDQFFMQISPHAIYKHVHLVPKEGRLFVLMSEQTREAEKWAELSEEELANKFNASLTFSSAQANVLAVCIFLSLALSQQWTSFEMIGIDDPFQNMDDINVFSFIDVICQVLTYKQVIISSHNEDFVSLVKNKSGLDSSQIGYIHFKSYSKNEMDLETNCNVE